MQNPSKPDLDAIAARLKTRHDALERALDAALARAGLKRDALAKLARLAERPEVAGRVTDARRELEARPAAAGVSWEELCRPSLASLTNLNLRSLRRA
jgi:hypothetical protein